MSRTEQSSSIFHSSGQFVTFLHKQICRKVLQDASRQQFGPSKETLLHHQNLPKPNCSFREQQLNLLMQIEEFHFQMLSYIQMVQISGHSNTFVFHNLEDSSEGKTYSSLTYPNYVIYQWMQPNTKGFSADNSPSLGSSMNNGQSANSDLESLLLFQKKENMNWNTAFFLSSNLKL